MIGFDKLRLLLEREIWRHKPKAIELCMPDEREVLPVNPEAVLNELRIRDVSEVKVVSIDVSLMPDRNFEYSLRVQVK